MALLAEQSQAPPVMGSGHCLQRAVCCCFGFVHKSLVRGGSSESPPAPLLMKTPVVPDASRRKASPVSPPPGTEDCCSSLPFPTEPRTENVSFCTQEVGGRLTRRAKEASQDAVLIVHDSNLGIMFF